jgi:cytochrome c-type protein NapC
MGPLRRFVRWLFSPSPSMSVFWLMLIGLAIGAFVVIGGQVAVAVTGTNEFCGTACHSHAQFVYPEYKQSVHYTNRTGVRAGCSDCHVPHDYPAKLFYKARAGLRDGIAEMRGVISTKEKFEKERWRMANQVWDEMRADGGAACQRCHDPAAMAADKQNELARKMHERVRQGKATCIDCHKGVAHQEPEEPELPAKTSSAN